MFQWGYPSQMFQSRRPRLIFQRGPPPLLFQWGPPPGFRECVIGSLFLWVIVPPFRCFIGEHRPMMFQWEPPLLLFHWGTPQFMCQRGLLWGFSGVLGIQCFSGVLQICCFSGEFNLWVFSRDLHLYFLYLLNNIKSVYKLLESPRKRLGFNIRDDTSVSQTPIKL